MTARASTGARRETHGGAAKSAPRPRPRSAPRSRPSATTQAPPRTSRTSAPPPKATRAARTNTAKSAPNRAPRQPRSPARFVPPPVAPCDDLMALFALDPVLARDHVDALFHAAMPAAQADAFGARGYRWELHLVALDHLHLLRAVDLVPSRIRRYRAALRRGASCAPLIGLGGEGKSPVEGVLLCDGYHRAVALRDAGIHFAWVWLAVDVWKDAVEEPVA